jgi:hypothetical protein
MKADSTPFQSGRNQIVEWTVSIVPRPAKDRLSFVCGLPRSLASHLQLRESVERRSPSPFGPDSGAPPKSTKNRDGNQDTNQREGGHGRGSLKKS